MKVPVHPGCFVKIEIVEAYGLSIIEAAEVLGVARSALSTFLNARSRLSPDLALRIEKTFGVSIDTLMRMQKSFDIAGNAVRVLA